MSWAGTVTDALACYRLTRLVTTDSITAPWRDAIIRWAYVRAGWAVPDPVQGWTKYAADDEDAPKLADGITCRWCVSMYTAAFVLAARRYIPKAWEPLSRVLALSAVGALLAGLEQD